MLACGASASRALRRLRRGLRRRLRLRADDAGSRVLIYGRPDTIAMAGVDPKPAPDIRRADRHKRRQHIDRVLHLRRFIRDKFSSSRHMIMGRGILSRRSPQRPSRHTRRARLAGSRGLRFIHVTSGRTGKPKGCQHPHGGGIRLSHGTAKEL